MKIGIVGKSRYIDADELIKSIDKEIFTNPTTRSYFKQIVRKQPTADVVEVVRCKDCKHFAEEMIEDDLEGFCKSVSGMINPGPDFYCSYGERREE